MNKLEELRNDAYENSRIIIVRTKFFHDKRIFQKTFEIGQKLLLYNFCLNLFPKKLKSKWSGPFIVKNVFPHGPVKIENLENSVIFKVNGKKLKPYLKYQPCEASTAINLSDPSNLD